MKEVASYTRSLDCVHCGLCLPVCPTYDVLGLETDSPRGRIYLMRALAEGRIERPADIRVHLDQCLGCRACETACPSGVAYGHILESVRHDLASTAPERGFAARFRRFALKSLVPHRGRLGLVFSALRLGQRLRLDRLAARLGLVPAAIASWSPTIPPRADRRPLHGSFAPTGTPRGRVALFTGCVMEQMFGDINRMTRDLLLANGFAVDVPRTQSCCGALLRHDGQADEAAALARTNLRAFADCDVILVNSAGCGAALRDYGEWLGADGQALADRCRDVCEFLGDHGLTAAPAPYPHRVAYDDPCHLCHGQGVRAQPRALLARVPEIELVAHRDPEDCCGSAGIYNLIHTELAEAIGARKAEALIDSGADCVVTGNPGCMMQIRAALARKGADVRVAHPVELLLPERPAT